MFYGGVPKVIMCDNLKAAVAKPLWFDLSLNKTVSDITTHYDTSVLSARPRKPRDKGKVEGAVRIVERWIVVLEARLWRDARLRNRQVFSIEALNVAIAELVDDLNARTMLRIGRSRWNSFENIDQPALSRLPEAPFEYAEWTRAKLYPDYHIEVLHGLYSVPHGLIGRQVDIRMTLRMMQIFHTHDRVAFHHRRDRQGGRSTIKEHMLPSPRRNAITPPGADIALVATPTCWKQQGRQP